MPPPHEPCIGIELYAYSFVGLLKDHGDEALPTSSNNDLEEFGVEDEFIELKTSLRDNSIPLDQFKAFPCGLVIESHVNGRWWWGIRVRLLGLFAFLGYFGFFGMLGLGLGLALFSCVHHG